MTPVDQSILHGQEEENGDCFRAAVATVLGLTLDQVPHFCRKGNDDHWFNDFVEWLQARGWSCFSFNPGPPDGWLMSVSLANTVYLLSGPSPRFADVEHQVVAKGAEIIHDPHPNRTGILPPTESRPWEAIVLFPNKPCAVRRMVNPNWIASEAHQ